MTPDRILPDQFNKSLELQETFNDFSNLVTRLNTVNQYNYLQTQVRPIFASSLHACVNGSVRDQFEVRTSNGVELREGVKIGIYEYTNYGKLALAIHNCGSEEGGEAYRKELGITDIQLKQMTDVAKAIKEGVLNGLDQLSIDQLSKAANSSDPKRSIQQLLGNTNVLSGIEGDVLTHIKEKLKKSQQEVIDLDLTALEEEEEEDGLDITILPEDRRAHETINGMEIVGQIGEPEDLNDPSKRKLAITTSSLRQLHDLLFAASNPGQNRGEIREIGFYGLGPDPRQGECGQRNIVIADEWRLSSTDIPSSVTDKHVGNQFTSEAWREADKVNKYVTVRGHDHHEVAMANPSQQDKEELGLHTMPVDVIVKRSRQPIVIAAYSTNIFQINPQEEFSMDNDEIDELLQEEISIHLDTSHHLHALKGFYIVRDNDMTEQDLHYFMSYFGYQNPDRSITVQDENGFSYTGELDKMTTVRPTFPASSDSFTLRL